MCIILSRKFAAKQGNRDTLDTRGCWVRIRGPVCNLLIIEVYLPPEHSRTSCIELLRDLRELLEVCSEHDCVILLGDFNVHLPRNYGKVTGQFSAERQAVRGQISLKQRDILRLLALHGLCAINTFFRPKKRQTVHTWRGNNLYKRRQLDYIMVSARWRSCFTDSKVEWSHSRLLKGKKRDHGLLLTKFRWRLGNHKRKHHINWRSEMMLGT